MFIGYACNLLHFCAIRAISSNNFDFGLVHSVVCLVELMNVVYAHIKSKCSACDTMQCFSQPRLHHGTLLHDHQHCLLN